MNLYFCVTSLLLLCGLWSLIQVQFVYWDFYWKTVVIMEMIWGFGSLVGVYQTSQPTVKTRQEAEQDGGKTGNRSASSQQNRRVVSECCRVFAAVGPTTWNCLPEKLPAVLRSSFRCKVCSVGLVLHLSAFYMFKCFPISDLWIIVFLSEPAVFFIFCIDLLRTLITFYLPCLFFPSVHSFEFICCRSSCCRIRL